MKYDYLIVGAGLSGAVFAAECKRKGKSCRVIDRRDHVGGNCHTCERLGIQVHRYGAHIFHTSDKKVWDYVGNYAEFNHYVNSPIARYKDELYNLPFNMNTFSKLWNVKTPKEAQEKIASQIAELPYAKDPSYVPKNLEEQALLMVGRDVYEKLVKGYTEKQWGRSCSELPASVIKRLPLRFTFNNNYFSDPFQGIPKEGYTKLTENLLSGIPVETGTEYRSFIASTSDTFLRTFYTGMIDEFFDFRLGHLEYRSLRFETKEMPGEPNFQGNAVVNYTERDIPYTRTIEHKHFVFGEQPDTVVTWEYPENWEPGKEPYYPMGDEKNLELYAKYKELAEKEKNIIFGGRLGAYKYYDMDKVVGEALRIAEAELG